jgi:glycosyltransferase involved in cell wall biosynthesis
MEADMLHLAMPFGSMHGWGVCTQSVAKELSRLTPLTLLTENFSAEQVNGYLDHLYLRQITKPIKEFIKDQKGPLSGALIQAIYNDTLAPWEPVLRGEFNLGYIFSEQTTYAPEQIQTARDSFDVIAAGSSWCEMVLRGLGLDNVRTILQGVDPSVFNPSHNQKSLYPDRFVVFSGGKFELRKSQDLVIAAFKRLLQKHDDALLVASWYNPWPQHMESMRLSRFVDYQPGEDYYQGVQGVLDRAGVPKDKVILLPPTPHFEMSRIYKNCDIGIFPNRCEGGSNLVLMEFLACGKPAIVSNSSGHKDVASRQNSLLLENLKKMRIINQDGSHHAFWDEPELDECIDRLLWAYDHPEELKALGRRAGEDMKAFTWGETAERFYHQVARYV